MKKTKSGIVYMGRRWWEEDQEEENPIRIIPLTNEDRGNGLLSLGPFMVIVEPNYLESVIENKRSKEAYGL